MDQQEQGRSARKHQAILKAATEVFLDKGYPGTSMEDIATLAGVSKQTVYKHFTDKDALFAEIVLATTAQVDGLVRLVADQPGPADDLAKALEELARTLLNALMQPDVLRLRRLVIANADRFPQLGRSWYERGFERVLATLAATFGHVTDQGRLQVDDPLTAADHFVGLLLWIPVNKAMFHGLNPYTQDELDGYAAAAVRTFLAAYGRPRVPAST